MMSEDTSPYNAYEIARARCALASDINGDTSFRFLHRKMNKLGTSQSRFSENMWEGPEGKMEHILTGFPMPPRVAAESHDHENIDRNISKSSDEKNVDRSVSKSNKEDQTKDILLTRVPPIPTPKNDIIDVKSSTSSDSEDEDIEYDIVQPTNNDTGEDQDALNSHTSNAGCFNSADSSSSSQPQSIVISDDSSENDNDSDKEDSSQNVSHVELKHRKRIAKLFNKISLKFKHFSRIKSSLKQCNEEKASKQVESLHWNIHGLISLLSEEKKCKDENSFKLIPSQEVLGSKGPSSSAIPCYHKTWQSLNDLCHRFEKFWKTNKSIFMKFTSIESSPATKFLERLEKIAVKDSKKKVKS